ncbi:MAG: hypothetical protein GYB66_02565 [Chloroflexi bacterium]|nr:hypothetical protein [Chloroflexota bacterium]
MRKLVGRLLGQKRAPSDSKGSAPLTSQNVSMSFRIYWTKIARQWDRQRIGDIRRRAREIIDAPEFDANPVERRYHVDSLDEQAHSGASLVALVEVLEALERDFSQQEALQ